MTYKDLERAHLQLVQAQRLYSVNDQHVVQVVLRHRQDELSVDVLLHEIAQADDSYSDGFEEVGYLDSVSAAVLIRFAEIKGIVESWMAGTLAELPASTSTATPRRRIRPRPGLRRLRE